MVPTAVFLLWLTVAFSAVVSRVTSSVSSLSVLLSLRAWTVMVMGFWELGGKVTLPPVALWGKSML